MRRNAAYEHAVRSACTGKIRYRDVEEAKRMKAKCEARRPETKLHWYSCDFCHGWHLGHEWTDAPREETRRHG